MAFRTPSCDYEDCYIYLPLAMPISRIATVVLLVVASSYAMAEEIVARSQTWAGSVSLVRDGSAWTDSCSLDLVAQFQQSHHRTQIKRATTNCSLFGPVQLILSEAQNHRDAVIIVEAARGGDGDHTGPLLEIFRIDKTAIQKLGEIELFSATYVRRAQEVQFIEGRLLFSLCTVCDGTEAADPNHNIFLPVRVSINRDGLAVTSTAKRAERTAIWSQFQQQKRAAKKEYGNAVQIASLEKNLRALLRIK